jgi:hypothetical protein
LAASGKLSDYQRAEAVKRRAAGETLAAISQSRTGSIKAVTVPMATERLPDGYTSTRQGYASPRNVTSTRRHARLRDETQRHAGQKAKSRFVRDGVAYWSKWRAAKATQGAPDQHGQNRA